MKKLVIALTGVLYILCSCEKDKNNLPPAEVHGTWMGTWSTNDNSLQGTFLVPANQSDDEIEGEIYVNIKTPSEVGYRPKYTGKVEANEVRVAMKIEGLEIRAVASLESETETSGVFQVGEEISGNFSGSKYPLTVPTIEQKYQIEQTEMWYQNLFLVNNEFWINNISTSMFEVIDIYGNFVESKENSMVEHRPASFDGTNFWVYGKDYENPNNCVYKLTTDGEVLDSISIEKPDVENISYLGNTLYCTFYSGGNTIYAVNQQGEFIDSTKFDYCYISKYIAYKEGFLLQSYSPYLIYINKHGELIHTYQLNHNIYDIARNANEDIYCLTDELIYENDISDTYRIIKVDI